MKYLITFTKWALVGWLAIILFTHYDYKNGNDHNDTINKFMEAKK